MSDAPAVEAVLFDLGGVLAGFGGVDAMRELAGIDDDEEVWRRWLTCRWVRAFERGACTPEEFAAGVAEDWALPIDGPAYLESFTSWLGGAFPGAEELVAEVCATGLVTGCLSNTNVVHWGNHIVRWTFVEQLEHRFLSHELGIVKPDREVFEEVARRLDLAPERILFLDDNQLNVDGARSVGYQAVRTQGVEEARRALEGAGVLPPA